MQPWCLLKIPQKLYRKTAIFAFSPSTPIEHRITARRGSPVSGMGL